MKVAVWLFLAIVNFFTKLFLISNISFVLQDFGIDKNLSERIMDIENNPALRGSLEKVG